METWVINLVLLNIITHGGFALLTYISMKAEEKKMAKEQE